LFDLEMGEAWRKGFHWHDVHSKELQHLNDKLKPLAQEVKRQWEEHGELNSHAQQLLEEINQGCKKMVWQVYNEAKQLLEKNKTVALVGGDHSSPEGLIQAICDKYNGDVGILHIDAHCDLRQAYQGFEHSHASIMYNVMNYHTPPKKLVQIGIRDFCKEEYDSSLQHPSIETFWDRGLKTQLLEGKPWSVLVDEIVQHLPQNVYISFDIDGLSPSFCPNTGTPVPGGLDFDQAIYLFKKLRHAGKTIVGFDLNEVAPSETPGDEWDGNVGARLLFQLCNLCV
ncbi:MAG: arginase family protein, partial [Bdellovibrionales bacterium]|nr:arginase family protein [Bdellovibrionales bacterium]